MKKSSLTRVALVTGASRGIGLAIARELASEGALLAITARGADLEEAAKSLGGAERVLAVRCDARDPAGLDRLFQAVQERFDHLNVLVNNVGGSLGAHSFLDSTEKYVREVLDLNLLTTFAVSRRAVDLMGIGGSDCIVNIASVFGRERGGGAIYNAAKAGVIALTKAMAAELAPRGIRVNCVAPGSILFPGSSWDRRNAADAGATDEFVRRNIPLGRFGTPQEVAQLVTFLAGPRTQYVTGACWVVDGGLSRSNL